MKKLWTRTEFRLWLSIVGCSTILLTAAFAMVQQTTRLAADDLPLINLQAAKNKLNQGTNPADVVSTPATDLAYDSVPFIMIANNSYKLLATSALMNGKTPLLPPKGVFEYTKVHKIDRFTWQPSEKIRLATRVERYKDGYVIAGQSLKEPENRIAVYTAIAALSWVTVTSWSSLVLLLPLKKPRTRK